MNLLKITTTPIKLDVTIKRARLEGTNARPRCAMKTKPAKMDIKAENIKVQIDSTEMKKSMGIKSAKMMTEDAADEGLKAAEEATERYVEEGNQMAQIYKGISVADIVSQRAFKISETMMTFIPSVGPDISWLPNSIEMNYTPQKIDINWNNIKNCMEYIPGEIKVNILQYPKVNIEYLGGPNYVPPSADPNYEKQ